MSFLLVGNWDVELARLKILIEDGPEALADLNPAYPGDHPVSLPPGATAGPVIDRLSEDLAALGSLAGFGGRLTTGRSPVLTRGLDVQFWRTTLTLTLLCRLTGIWLT